MPSLFSALAPKAEFSFADVVDEVHRLREENALLKGQVALLSQERLNPGSTPAAAAAAVAAAAAAASAPASEGGGSAAGALQSLRAELAVNLGASPQEVRAAQAKSLAAQLAASREQLGWLQVARDVEVHATGAELHQAEEALLRMRQRQAARQAQADEREALLLQQAAVAQQAQHTAVAESRQQMAASQAALEEQVLALQEEVARRDALQEQFGVDEELAEGARQARAWEARCHLKQEEVDRLQDEAAAAQRLVEPQLRRCKGRADEAEAALQAAQKQLAEKEAVQRHMEAQVVRLSEAFNRQVEERDDIQSDLEAAEMKRRQMVEKGVARSWLVNFVENRERRPEFLRLMASWWEFSEGDLIRVGLAEELPPEPGLSPDATLTEAFAHFLERHEGEDAEPPLPPRLPPQSRRGSSSGSGSLARAK